MFGEDGFKVKKCLLKKSPQCHSSEAVCLRMLKCLGVHHSNESWNPEKLLILREILDSIFRWNDETTAKFSILGQTASLE